jgi:Ca-activated chloride channel family protein
MRKLILIAIFCINCVFAQGRIYIPPFPEIPELPIIPVELTAVKATIKIGEDVARVKLEQSFQNKSRHTLEGDYLYSLPGIAQINEFYLYINGKKTKGELLDNKKARIIYEDIVRRMKDPALLEYTDYGLFKARIFPITAGETRKIELSYDQVVPFESGHYKFELPVRQSGQGAIDNYEISIGMENSRGLANIYSPSHNIELDRSSANEVKIRFKSNHVDGSRNFVLFYSITKSEIDGSLLTFRPRTDKDGYFIFFANPAFNLSEKKTIAKDVIFVVDISGSMGGEKIEQARDALRFCVNVLNKNDRFEIISFSSSVQNFAGRLTSADKENINNALYFAGNLNASGGTNINEALLKALDLKKTKDTRPTSIVFLTDGLPTEGVTGIEQIVRNIQSKSNGFIRLFNFGVGYDVNTWLIDKLAGESGGSAAYVKPGENIENAISTLFAKISSPLLTDTEFSVSGMDVYDIYPQKLPDIFKGQRVMITGRYRKSGEAQIIIKGSEEGKTRQFKYEAAFEKRENENDFIAKLWANRKVNHLLNKIRFEGENDELVQSVKNLAEEFGIVTPYTSYLVTEQQSEFAAAERNQRQAPIMAQKLRSRKESMESKGVGAAVYDALSVQSADAASSSGYSAVMGSSARKSMMADAEQDEEMLFIHKNVAGKSFKLLEGIWTEQGIEIDTAQTIEIVFMSKEYLLLAEKDADVKRILALGSDVIFQWQERVYRITK